MIDVNIDGKIGFDTSLSVVSFKNYVEASFCPIFPQEDELQEYWEETSLHN